jgi:hypothetical protein
MTVKSPQERAMVSIAALATFRPSWLAGFLEFARGLDEETLASMLTRSLLAKRRWAPQHVHEMVKIILVMRREGWKTIH